MGSKLESQLQEQLKQCSKDEASYSKLEEIVEGIIERYDKVSNELNLLEQAIKHDYDSILITELDLETPGPRIVYVNGGFTRMTGYSKEEAIGKTPRILQGEKTDRHVLDRLKKRLIEGQAFFGHTVNYRKDGTEFINQWDIHPLTNQKGEITHWVSYQRDITERKESSKLVFDAKLDFDGLTEESKKTYIDIDVQGNIVSANNSFKKTLGYDADELKQIKIWDLVKDNDRDEMKFFFEDFDHEKIDEKKYPWNFFAKDGSEIQLEGDINYFVTNDETIIRIQFENITLRNRIIETLKKKKANLASILNKKDEFSLRFVKDGSSGFRCKFVSDTFKSITGLDGNLIRDEGMSAVLSNSDDVSKVDNALNDAFNGNSSTISCSYKTEGGNEISVVQSFRPSYGADETTVDSVKSVGMIEMEVED